jgi:Domain of unknown function (DUF4886)
MRKSVIFVLLIIINFVFATDMIIQKIDGSIETIPLEEIENITFNNTVLEPPNRVLFIGNSYTYGNGGMNARLQEFVQVAHPELDFTADAVTGGGATLEMHYNNASTLETIENGNWNYVILQEQSTRPIDDPELMYQYATLLDGVITNANAETAFFMTWARAYDPEMIEGLAAAYDYIGEQLDTMVCPVGRAWQNSLQQNPELILHVSDDSHPNVWGTYLSICVFYASLFGESPEGVDYVIDPQITDSDRDFLQTIAWETVLQYNPWN